MSRTPRLVLALLLGSTLAACGTEKPGDTTDPGQVPGDKPQCIGTVKTGSQQIECNAQSEIIKEGGSSLSTSEIVVIDVGNIKSNKSQDFYFAITNTKNAETAAALFIKDVRFEYEPASATEDAEVEEKLAFRCLNEAGDLSCAKTSAAKAWKVVVPAAHANPAKNLHSKEQIIIRYTRFDSTDRQAKLIISLGGDVVKKEYVINFVTKQGKPKAIVNPAEVRFDYTAPGTVSPPKTVRLTNTGSAVLQVSRIDFTADPAFKVKLDDKEFAAGTAIKLADGTPIEIEAGKFKEFTVVFAPKDGNPKQGTLLPKTNDASAGATLDVKLIGNSEVPCIKLDPVKVNFGGVLVGGTQTHNVAIKNCGAIELSLNSIAFLAAGTNSSEFSVNWAKMLTKCPGINVKNGPTAAAPCVIKKGETAEIVVEYSPADISKIDAATKQPVQDQAVLEFKSNTFVTPKLTIDGIGVAQVCPLAVIKVKEGEEVVPQTTLNLVSDQSKGAGGGPVKKHKWSVKQPAGSNQPLLPNASFPNPKLLANASGEYEFCLEVWDANDVKSCVPACQKVQVVPNNAIHVELLWDTPSDPDQTDSGPAAGADMDLHFAHQISTAPDYDCDGVGDPWFNNPFDTFWFNSNPNWGSANSAVEDDPSLDLDDTDGAGPENLNLAEPEGEENTPNAYSVGVHYWNDHGLGESSASVSIYLQGTLSVQIPKVKMKVLDMWYVGKINWPNVLTGNKLPVFTPCYQSGDACLGVKEPSNPKAGKMWKATGNWCITPCYVNEIFAATAGGVTSGKCKK